MSLNESKAPPWFVSSTDEKHPQFSSTSWMFGTSIPAEGPEYVMVKPAAVAFVTVTVPAKPGIALIAFVRIVLLYDSDGVLLMSSESLPPMRNAEPVEERCRPAA